MSIFNKWKKSKFVSSILIGGLIAVHITCSVPATEADYEADAANRLNQPIASNEIENWPVGPVVGAQGAILIEANTQTVLYSKNIHEKLYPASTTKILTTLIAIENADLNDMVEFSTEAVFSIEPRSSNMGMDVGQSITMEQCLYGILVYSANEVANAVAEHVAGSMDSFVEMMNQRAAELGCTDSHFVTTNGLHDENHYTSPYDLSLIARAFFANETLAKISGYNGYIIEPTSTQPDLIELYTHNKLTNGTYPYDGYIGGKTGYTSIAHQTLVSCAERNGMKLICVVMKEDAPAQYTDTIALFDYGFSNFQKVNVADNEKNYTVANSDFFDNNSEVFGSNEAIMSIQPQDYVILPNTMSFEDLESSLSYEENPSEETAVATIEYSYNGVSVGSAQVELAADNKDTYDFDSPVTQPQSLSANNADEDSIIFINVIKIILIVVGILLFFVLIILLRAFFKNYHFSRHRRQKLKFKSNRVKRRRRRRDKRPRIK